MYAEHMQNFSVVLMVPSNAYGKLTQPMRGSERQEIFLLPPRRPDAILDLVSHQKHIFLKTTQQSPFRILNVWVIRPNILLSCLTNMVHVRTYSHKASGTTCSSTSLNIRLIIDNHTQRHIWELPVIHYHKIMVIYHYPFLVVITQLFSCIIFINGCICILTGSPG